jgi:hypothetical protein
MPVAASKANSAIDRVRAAIKFNPIDGRMATKVPAVPGNQGMYPMPAPDTAKRTNLRSSSAIRNGCTQTNVDPNAICAQPEGFTADAA